MDYFLVKEDFKLTLLNNKSRKGFSSNVAVSLKLEPSGPMARHIRDIYTHRLSSFLGTDWNSLPKKIKICGSIQVAPAHDVNQEENWRQGDGGKMALYFMDDASDAFFQRIFKAFTPEFQEEGAPEAKAVCNALIRVKLRLPDTQSPWEKESSDFPIEECKGKDNKLYGYGTVVTINNVAEQVTRSYTTGSMKFTGIFKIILVLNDAALNTLLVNNHHHYCPSPRTTTASFTLQEMLENDAEATATDTYIVPGGEGALPVKFYHEILAARSPVFNAMLRSGKEDAVVIHSIPIKEMNELEVRSFVDYMETLDLKTPLAESQIALQMLKAGNHYKVPDLCTAMYELIMIKRYDWFDVDAAVSLLVFASDLCTSTSVVQGSQVGGAGTSFEEPHWKDLKLKALQVMKWYSTEKPADLRNSKKYKDFFEQRPWIAMELVSNFLRCVDMDTLRGGPPFF